MRAAKESRLWLLLAASITVSCATAQDGTDVDDFGIVKGDDAGDDTDAVVGDEDVGEGQDATMPGDDSGAGKDVAQSTDSGVIDTGVTDTGVVDTGFDTGVVDTGFDTGVVDTGFDTGVVDTGFDTGVVDTGPRDTGVVDTGPRDTGVVETGPAEDTGLSGRSCPQAFGSQQCRNSENCCAVLPPLGEGLPPIPVGCGCSIIFACIPRGGPGCGG